MCDGHTFNGTEGVITTSGYPYNLSFNNTCLFYIDVDSGKIELTFTNVSLPDGSKIAFDGMFLTVGVHPVQSRVAYVHRHKTFVFVVFATNFTGAYGGVKLLYRRIPDGKSTMRILRCNSILKVKLSQSWLTEVVITN